MECYSKLQSEQSPEQKGPQKPRPSAFQHLDPQLQVVSEVVSQLLLLLFLLLMQAVESQLQAVESRLQAVESLLQAVESRVQAVESRLQTVQAVESRLQAAESRLQAVESRLQAVESQLLHERSLPRARPAALPPLQGWRRCRTPTSDAKTTNLFSKTQI